MNIDERKALARASLQAWAAGAQISAASLFTPDYVNHQEPLADGGIKSIDQEQWMAVVEDNKCAFPDLSVQIIRQIGEDDQVATHWRFTGTQQGHYQGHPPSGRTTSWSGIQVDRFDGDRIAESWVIWDKYTLFADLGLMK